MSMASNRVYSTESGRICPDCNNPITNCTCSKAKNSTSVSQDGFVRLSRETKGRKGAGVTLISGLGLEGAELKTLAKKLKQLCSSGGAIKDGIIEIQGDHRDTIQQWLEKNKYKVKRVGG